MQIRKQFADSAKGIKNTRVLAGAAMVLALGVMLGFYSLPLTETNRISFTFLADAVSGMLFGPFVSMVHGALADILSFIIRPTGPYFPGFTLTRMLTGLFYGIALYRRKCTLVRSVVSNTAVSVLLHVLLNSLWITMLYGKAFFVLLPPRIIKEAILLPINIVLLYAVCRLLERTEVFRMFRQNNP